MLAGRYCSLQVAISLEAEHQSRTKKYTNKTFPEDYYDPYPEGHRRSNATSMIQPQSTLVQKILEKISAKRVANKMSPL